MTNIILRLSVFHDYAAEHLLFSVPDSRPLQIVFERQSITRKSIQSISMWRCGRRVYLRIFLEADLWLLKSEDSPSDANDVGSALGDISTLNIRFNHFISMSQLIGLLLNPVGLPSSFDLLFANPDPSGPSTPSQFCSLSRISLLKGELDIVHGIKVSNYRKVTSIVM